MKKKRSNMIELEAGRYFNEYYDLTGKNFPPCNREDWDSLNDWLVDLKVAVYRERAIKTVYGDRKGASDTEAPKRAG